MSSKRKRSKGTLSVVEIADLAKSNPYIQRLIDDPKLRKNVRTAIDSSRSAYGRLSNGKVVPRSLTASCTQIWARHSRRPVTSRSP
jgi:hypothetical protein